MTNKALSKILKDIEKIGWSITTLFFLLILLACIVGGCYVIIS